MDSGLNEEASKLIEQIWYQQQKSSVGRLLPGPKGLPTPLEPITTKYVRKRQRSQDGSTQEF